MSKYEKERQEDLFFLDEFEELYHPNELVSIENPRKMEKTFATKLIGLRIY